MHVRRREPPTTLDRCSLPIRWHTLYLRRGIIDSAHIINTRRRSGVSLPGRHRRRTGEWVGADLQLLGSAAKQRAPRRAGVSNMEYGRNRGQTPSLSRVRDFTGQRWRGGRGELAGREFRSYKLSANGRKLPLAPSVRAAHARRRDATQGSQNACPTDARIVEEHKELRGPTMALQ